MSSSWRVLFKGVFIVCFLTIGQAAHAQSAPDAATAPTPAAAPANPPAASPTDGPALVPDRTTAPSAPPVVTVTTTTVSKTAAAGATVVHTDLPADLSVMGMLRAADPIVKGVMALLAAASVVTWAIFVFKTIELFAFKTRAQAGLRSIANSGTLQQVANDTGRGAVARLVRSAVIELEASETLPAYGIKERVAIALQRVENASARKAGLGTGVLASVGSTGPFIGLFGTVWGIMNSFIHISNAHTTNLSVVAPGIAEALLATAMGLVAAIPAVLIYNLFSRAIANYRALLGDASAGIMRHVSRDLDRAELLQYPVNAAE